MHSASRSNQFTYMMNTDPHSMTIQKALEAIGKALQTQYERWQPRVITTTTLRTYAHVHIHVHEHAQYTHSHSHTHTHMSIVRTTHPPYMTLSCTYAHSCYVLSSLSPLFPVIETHHTTIQYLIGTLQAQSGSHSR